MRNISAALIATLFTITATAQEFNGKNVVWRLPDDTDKRFTALFGTNGRFAGYEDCSVAITNRHSNKLSVTFKVVITDMCGNSTTRNITHTVRPGQKAGSNAFMEGFSFEGKGCEERRKYGENFYTKIGRVNLQVEKVVEYDEKGKVVPAGSSTSPGSAQSGTPNGTGSQNSQQTTQGNTGTGEYSSCNAVGFKYSGPPGFTCINLEWWCSTGAIYTKGNEVTTVTESQNFIVQWRKKGETSWSEKKVSGCLVPRNPIHGLEPCTRYEVRLIRDCGKGVTAASGTDEFTTACLSPFNIRVTNYGRDNASISTMSRSSGTICESSINIKFVTEVEYKTAGGTWETVVCVRGEGCKLYALQPSTTYSVRARFKYENGKYSEYSSETSFTTKP